MQSALQSNPDFIHATQAKQFQAQLSFAREPARAVAAAVQIQQALKTDPNYVPAIMASVTIAESRGELAAAGEACEQILKRYPDFRPAIKKLALYYSEIPGKEQRAYELAVKARETAPNDSEIASTIGILSYRRGEFLAAARLLAQSVQSGASDGKTLYYLGMAQFQLKRTQESKTTLQQALTKNLPGPLADEAKRVLAQIK